MTAYIDAGTGSAILALLAGGFSGAWVLIKEFFPRWFSGRWYPVTVSVDDRLSDSDTCDLLGLGGTSRVFCLFPENASNAHAGRNWALVRGDPSELEVLCFD